MAGFEAIGGVSETLRRLLKDRMELPSTIDPAVNDVSITIGTPRTPHQDEQTTEALRVNLFLYQVVENGTLKNQDMPGQGHPAAYGRPPLSLDLHYLITTFGTSMATPSGTDETLAQQLLGSAMRVLHDHAVIHQDLADAGQNPILDPSLQGEFEKIKLVLHPVSLEDLSKVWTALSLPYRLSVAYKVSVVQIESRRRRSYPQRVKGPPASGPRVYALPINRPYIDEIRVIRLDDPEERKWPYPYARAGDRLVLMGRHLSHPDLRVLVGDLEAEVLSVASLRIACRVPPDEALQPGPQPVKVLVDVAMGDPPVPHRGFSSNTAFVALVPRIATIALAASGREAAITGSHLYHPGLACLTLMGDTEIDAGRYLKATPEEISFPLPSLQSGRYTVRVRVNGMENIDDTSILIP